MDIKDNPTYKDIIEKSDEIVKQLGAANVDDAIRLLSEKQGADNS